jgi:hypothetical protein
MKIKYNSNVVLQRCSHQLHSSLRNSLYGATGLDKPNFDHAVCVVQIKSVLLLNMEEREK